jgi:hypothetical protein
MRRDKYVSVPLLTCGLYVLWVALFSNDLADYDLWGYLSFGRIFWEEGTFPYQDVFSYTPTKKIWVYHEWLTGVCFYPIYAHAGAAGLQLLRYVILMLTIYLIYLTAQKRGGSVVWRLIALLPGTLLISFGYVPVRAQIFTYLFFALSLFLLESARKEERWSLLRWLLPIQVLWCNFHGGYPAGLGVIFLYGLGERWAGRRGGPFLKMGIGAALVTVLNPYGIHYWTYTFQAVTMPRPDIDEWVSVLAALQKAIYGVPVLIFLIMSVLLVLFYLYRRSRDYTDLLVLAVMILLGSRHVRHTVFLGLIFGAYLPLVLHEYWDARKEKKDFGSYWRWVPQMTLVLLWLGIYGFVNPNRVFTMSPTFSLITSSPSFPVGAYYWMIQHRFQGKILSQFEWGEFFLWYFYPACRVAMDGRYETVYEEQVIRDYFQFQSGKKGGREFLRKYPPDLIVIRPNSGAEFVLRAEPGWKKIYADSGCVIYRPVTGKGAANQEPSGVVS